MATPLHHDQHHHLHAAKSPEENHHNEENPPQEQHHQHRHRHRHRPDKNHQHRHYPPQDQQQQQQHAENPSKDHLHQARNLPDHHHEKSPEEGHSHDAKEQQKPPEDHPHHTKGQHQHQHQHHTPTTSGDSEHQQQDDETPPLFLGFNHDSTRFACGTNRGFRVYDTDPMKECFNGMDGGVGIIEPLLCTNILMIVGGGPKPRFPLNKVMMWDNAQGAFCGEFTYEANVRAVKLTQELLVVVLENEIYVNNFDNARLLFKMDTVSNPKGLCALSMKADPSIVACPGLQKGEVRIERVGSNRGRREEGPYRETTIISAHDSGLACMALTLDGSLLATASHRGTIIRVFNTRDGTRVQELRRGADRAEIYSIAFSANPHWLAVSSDKGTVHVFGLKAVDVESSVSKKHPPPLTVVRNPGSAFSRIRGVLPKYFSSEWSFAQFKLPEEMKSKIAFAREKHIIFILGSDGSFYKCAFDPEHAGDMVQEKYINFIKPRNKKSA